MASYFAPPLTTMRQDFNVIGQQAAKLLITAVDAANMEPQHLSLPAELIVRRSTTSI